MDLDSRFKILNRSDKRTLWSLMTVSLWFSSSSPFSFSSCFFLFLSVCLFISLCVGPRVSSWGGRLLCLVQTSPQQATEASCTQLASRGAFVSSVLISCRMFSPHFSTLDGSKVKMDAQRWISDAFLSSLLPLAPFLLTLSLCLFAACFPAFLVFLSHVLR